MMKFDQTRRLGRRATLQGAALASGLGLAGLPVVALAADAPFLDVSQRLTGETSLDPALAGALHAAFLRQDARFDAKLARLAPLLAQGAALTGANADLAKLPQAILTGWYLGLVGIGTRTVCVAYASDLSNQLVADKLRPPSYAYGAYGSWAASPV